MARKDARYSLTHSSIVDILCKYSALVVVRGGQKGRNSKHIMMDAASFIDQEIPLKYRCVLPRALKTAYEAVNLTLNETPYLQIPSAKMAARGHLISFAVAHALQRLTENGNWPFQCQYDFYARPTGKHLRILTPNAIVTVCQLQHEGKQPRSAEFRQNYSLSNQLLFPFEAAEMEISIGVNNKKHLILAHGYHDLDFIHILVPSPHGEGYLAKTNNIMLEMLATLTDVVPVEEIDKCEVVTLKETLQKQTINGV